ncbi:MAG: prolyl oligopeptidase [Verrucomicrobiales bacterium]|nr:prolyl oligopeptidase [Verrucomicrobiales bacterium]
MVAFAMPLRFLKSFLALSFILTPHLHAAPLLYPPTRTVDQVDQYHGVSVPDPYRWLEDDLSPETAAWVKAQNKISFDYLEKIPDRQKFRDRIRELWNYEKYGVPVKHGDKYFLTRNDGLQNQSVLYVAKNLSETPRVLLDPNLLSTNGTIALASYSFTEDAAWMAYAISRAGSDLLEWKIRNVATGKDLEDLIEWSRFSGASWTKDGKGFFYSRYDEPKNKADRFKGALYFQKLYYHARGTLQAEDKLVYERPDHKDWAFEGTVTDDGKYLVIHVSQGTETKNRFFYKSLEKNNMEVVELLTDFDASYAFIDNDGPLFWFRTDLGAPRGRVIAIDTTKPARKDWKEIISQSGNTLRGVSLVNNQFLLTFMKDAHSEVHVHGLDGKFIRNIELPGIGSAGGFEGRRKDTETFYSFTSFTDPGVIYHLDLKTAKSSVYKEAKLPFDKKSFVTEQVFFQSRDGTKIPMFLVTKAGAAKRKTTPTLLYGYGGFNISLTPAFSVANLVWVEQGGMYAQPNLRGGGEYGEEWHRAGMKLTKQNVFDDFIAAAEWLIQNQYTSPSTLAISGGSNGGLLVGACETQRPDLFRVALPAVGVMDMLRFNKFTIGWGWMSDYGSPDQLDEFKALYAYSPYHRLKPGVNYPSTLITTGDHDDRVVPAHSFKFAAALQKANSGANPMLIRIDTDAGHGGGKPTGKRIDEAADRLAFAWDEIRKGNTN